MVRVGIVGAGGIAGRHIDSLAQIADAQVTAVLDTNIERARSVAQSCNATACESLARMFELVDAVYVLTPPSTHAQIVCSAAAAGRHIVCEKPLAVTLDDGRRMVDAARKAGVLLITSFKFRFHHGFLRIKEMVDSGSIGKLTSIWCQRIARGAGSSPEYNWRTDPALLCGMSIESLSHDIDIMRWIAGEVIDVRAVVSNTRADLPGFDNNASVTLTFDSGAVGTIHASWSSYISLSSRGVIGTRGAAYAEGASLFDLERLHWKTDQMPHERIDVINDRNDLSGFVAENEHFIGCIRDGKEPEVTGEDGLRALQISHAILESSRLGTSVQPAQLR